MKNLFDLYQAFSKEICGVSYSGVFPKPGNMAYRLYGSITYYYKISEVDNNKGIVTLVNHNNLTVYAKFQTRGKDIGKFCMAHMENGKLKIWSQSCCTKHDGHIIIITNEMFNKYIC